MPGRWRGPSGWLWWWGQTLTPTSLWPQWDTPRSTPSGLLHRMRAVTIMSAKKSGLNPNSSQTWIQIQVRLFMFLFVNFENYTHLLLLYNYALLCVQNCKISTEYTEWMFVTWQNVGRSKGYTYFLRLCTWRKMSQDYLSLQTAGCHSLLTVLFTGFNMLSWWNMHASWETWQPHIIANFEFSKREPVIIYGVSASTV